MFIYIELNKKKIIKHTRVSIIFLRIIFLLFSVLFLLLRGEASAGPETPIWLMENKVIAHAMGGINGDTYTNSHEAFELSYRRGFRLFEVDFLSTSEGVLVALHHWEQILNERPFLRYWIGRVYRRFFNRGGPLSIEEIKKRRVYGKYRPLDIYEVMKLFSEKKDTYLVTDVKDDQMAGLAAIKATAQSISKDLMARIIPQVYYPEELKPILAIHPFKWIIFTLYRCKLDDNAVVSFATEHKNRIVSVTMSTSRFNPDIVPAAF